MYSKSVVYRTLRDFYQNEQGTYVLLTGVMSFVLIGVIALATDGSGLLLDRSRLSQGLEQAGLALIAENNTNRNDADKNATTGEIKGHTYLNATKKSGNNGKVDHKQRDQELLKGYVNAYLPDAKIKNDFKHECKQEDVTDPRSVTCKVEGSVKRVSWLPMKSDLSFAPDVDISSGPVTVSKTLDELVPLDLMLVTDVTGSMNRDTDGGYSGTPKIDSLRNVVTSVSDELLEKDSPEVSPHNRIRFVSFTFGAMQMGNQQCHLPYFLTSTGKSYLSPDDNGSEFLAWLGAFKNSLSVEERYKVRGEFLNRLVDGINYTDTVKKIETFKGEAIKYPIYFDQNSWCFGNENTSIDTTSKDWYGKGKGKELQKDFKAIVPSGATLSSSGMLIGANLLMDKNKDSQAKPSEVKANTQRILLILSDGKDQIYDLETANSDHVKYIEKFPELTSTTITEKLINHGACEAIRKRLDTLQDNKYKKRPSRIHFVAFGYGPEGAQKEAWLKCVGKDNYHEASDEAELLETFRHIVNKREEVGGVIPTNY